MRTIALSGWKPSPRKVLADARDQARRYDALAFHVRRLCERTGIRPVATLADVEGDLAAASSTDEILVKSQTFERLKARVVHRPIDMPSGSRFGYEVLTDNRLLLTARDEDVIEEPEWVYSLTHPPAAFADQATASDALPTMAAQGFAPDLPGARWVPLTMLIEVGRFHRMQEWADRLVDSVETSNFHCFVSHRWLTPTHPDPDGVQGGLIAWQLVAHLCEAVFVGHLRGLSAPRRYNHNINAHVGLAGSELAESLLVNVVRRTLTAETLPLAFEEARSIEEFLEDRGVESAARDPDLAQLRGLFATRPLLAQCATRINIWYDYSCMPQEPRTAEEQRLFEDGLSQLNALQALGVTVVLLDDVSNYLCRAWCILEAVFADSVLPAPLQIISGSAVARANPQRAEYLFRETVRDRPHLIWRAVLDTEVFHTQSSNECMDRLGLATTRPQDLTFVYSELRRLNAPVAIHIDESELVTGCFPLPVTADRKSVVLTRAGGRNVAGSAATDQVVDLDWTDCSNLERAWNGPEAATPFMFSSLLVRNDEAMQHNVLRSPCHVAIIAGCEGEAVVIANWLWHRLDELTAIVGRPIHTLSWLATDIAPVGHFADGNLTFNAVDADMWVVAALSTRLAYCSTTALLQRSLEFAGKSFFELAIDQAEKNLVRVAKQDGAQSLPGDNFILHALPRFVASRFPGGVFRDDLLTAIGKNADAVA